MFPNLAVHVSPAGLRNKQIRIRRLTPPAEMFRPPGFVVTDNPLRFDTPERDNGNFVAAFRAPSDTESLMDVE